MQPMTPAQVNGQGYVVCLDQEGPVVRFQGVMSPDDLADYVSIKELLALVLAANPPSLTLDFKQLESLDASGLDMLEKFIVGMRQRKGTRLSILASRDKPWQAKAMKTFGRLLPELKVEIF